VLFRARGLARGLVFAGQTHPGNTTWEPWKLNLAGIAATLGFQTKVDTSQAGFTQVPCYFATLQMATLNPLQPPAFVAPLEHVTNEAVNGFTFRLWFPQLFMPGEQVSQSFAVNKEFAKFNARSTYYVSWIGIQNRPVVHATDTYGVHKS
jgi:hypothetical protein